MKLFTRTPREKLDGRVYCTSKPDTETCKSIENKKNAVYILNCLSLVKDSLYPFLPTFPYIVQSNYLDPVGMEGGEEKPQKRI